MIALTVNGELRELAAPARTRLADTLREELGLTGTHLGCEQGVCGACTVLLNGVPVRACLISAHEAEGAEVTTIEGLDDDPVATALRDAFSRHHALQCGYCTPGMLVTARDVVLRLGAEAGEARVREELAGNLCRCTGYQGAVRAVAEVAAAAPAIAVVPRQVPVTAAEPTSTLPTQPKSAADLPHRLTHEVALRVAPDAAWTVLSDPRRLAACIPGARLVAVAGEAVEGEIAVSLGPFAARFRGEGSFALDPAARTGTLRGRGREGGSGAEGEIGFSLAPEATGGSLLRLSLGWRVSGPLGQFSRPALLRGLVAALADEVARRIAMAAGSDAAAPGPPRLWARVGGWLRRLLGRNGT